MRRAFWLLLLSATARAQDFQVWNEIDLTAAWRKIDFLIPSLVRDDTHLANPQLWATGITAEIPLKWGISLTGGYLFADLTQRSDAVHLPLIAVSETRRIAGFTVSDRNRFEKLVGYPGSPVRYRNRILLDRAFGPGKRWHLFTADEAFFNLSTLEWNQNRFQAGGGARLNRRLGLDIYYLQKNAAGGAAHVLGTTLKVALGGK
jgi:hypothetical protein